MTDMNIRHLLYTFILFVCTLTTKGQTPDFTEAVKLYQSGNYLKSVEILESLSPTKEGSLVLMMNYMKLGDSQIAKNDTLAQDYLLKALKWSEECDPQMKEVEQLRATAYTLLANSCSSMSIDAYDIGKYRESLDLGQRALSLRRQYLGPDHASYASSLSLVAKTHDALGHYDEAIRLTEESLKITERNQGKESLRYASKLNNLSVFLRNKGNFSEALRLCNESIRIHELNHDTASKEYAIVLSNLAAINFGIGNNHEALKISRQVLRLKEATVGKMSASYAMSLANHAQYVAEKGDVEKAILSAMESLTIFEQTNGIVSKDYATTISEIAYYNMLAEHYDNAVKLQQSQLPIIEKLFGRTHPEYVTSLNNLAFNCLCNQDFENGLKYALEADKIGQQLFEPSHPTTIDTQEIIAFASYFLNREKDVETYSLEATRRFLDYMLNAFPGLSVRERKKLWTSHDNWFNVVNRFAATFSTPPLVANAYNEVLLSKGFLLNSEMEMIKLIQESGDSRAVEDYQRLSDARRRLQKIMQLPRSQRGTEADSLYNEVTELERLLSSRSKEFGNYADAMRINWKDVQKGLKPQDVAVEFCRYTEKNGDPSYLALVLTGEMKSPVLVKLTSEEEISRLITAGPYASDALTKAVWQPVFEVAKGKKRVFFSPDGEFYKVGIEYLPSLNGKGFLSDSMEFYRMSSTRFLAEKKSRTPITTAVVYGGIEYNTDASRMAEETVGYSSEEDKIKAEASKSVSEDIGLRAGITFLPATKEEANDIGRMLSEAKIKHTLLTMSDGTEASFKSLSGKGVNLLHIATHGFFWTNKETKRLKNVYFLQADTRSSTLEDTGMARSGLLLAGANTSLRGAQLPPDAEDGILTAEEISHLDFRNMDLVVMSACQTGLGDISGDGVFGLQRGFKKAGANSLLMSLWKVDDTATHLLMDEFYKNLTAGKNKHDAFMSAQQFLRTTDNGKFSDPRFWAAFILLDAIQ